MATIKNTTNFEFQRRHSGTGEASQNSSITLSAPLPRNDDITISRIKVTGSLNSQARTVKSGSYIQIGGQEVLKWGAVDGTYKELSTTITDESTIKKFNFDNETSSITKIEVIGLLKGYSTTGSGAGKTATSSLTLSTLEITYTYNYSDCTAPTTLTITGIPSVNGTLRTCPNQSYTLNWSGAAAGGGSNHNIAGYKVFYAIGNSSTLSENPQWEGVKTISTSATSGSLVLSLPADIERNNYIFYSVQTRSSISDDYNSTKSKNTVCIYASWEDVKFSNDIVSMTINGKTSTNDNKFKIGIYGDITLNFEWPKASAGSNEECNKVQGYKLYQIDDNDKKTYIATIRGQDLTSYSITPQNYEYGDESSRASDIASQYVIQPIGLADNMSSDVWIEERNYGVAYIEVISDNDNEIFSSFSSNYDQGVGTQNVPFLANNYIQITTTLTNPLTKYKLSITKNGQVVTSKIQTGTSNKISIPIYLKNWVTEIGAPEAFNYQISVLLEGNSYYCYNKKPSVYFQRTPDIPNISSLLSESLSESCYYWDNTSSIGEQSARNSIFYKSMRFQIEYNDKYSSDYVTKIKLYADVDSQTELASGTLTLNDNGTLTLNDNIYIYTFDLSETNFKHDRFYAKIEISDNYGAQISTFIQTKITDTTSLNVEFKRIKNTDLIIKNWNFTGISSLECSCSVDIGATGIYPDILKTEYEQSPIIVELTIYDEDNNSETESAEIGKAELTSRSNEQGILKCSGIINFIIPEGSYLYNQITQGILKSNMIAKIMVYPKLFSECKTEEDNIKYISKFSNNDILQFNFEPEYKKTIQKVKFSSSAIQTIEEGAEKEVYINACPKNLTAKEKEAYQNEINFNLENNEPFGTLTYPTIKTVENSNGINIETIIKNGVPVVNYRLCIAKRKRTDGIDESNYIPSDILDTLWFDLTNSDTITNGLETNFISPFTDYDLPLASNGTTEELIFAIVPQIKYVYNKNYVPVPDTEILVIPGIGLAYWDNNYIPNFSDASFGSNFRGEISFKEQKPTQFYWGSSKYKNSKNKEASIQLTISYKSDSNNISESKTIVEEQAPVDSNYSYNIDILASEFSDTIKNLKGVFNYQISLIIKNTAGQEIIQKSIMYSGRIGYIDLSIRQGRVGINIQDSDFAPGATDAELPSTLDIIQRANGAKDKSIIRLEAATRLQENNTVQYNENIPIFRFDYEDTKENNSGKEPYTISWNPEQQLLNFLKINLNDIIVKNTLTLGDKTIIQMEDDKIIINADKIIGAVYQ